METDQMNAVDFNAVTKDIGRFLEAIGKALQETPVPVHGQLQLGFLGFLDPPHGAFLDEVSYTMLPRKTVLKLVTRSCLPVRGLTLRLEDGAEIIVPSTVINGLQLNCDVQPVVEGDKVVLYKHVEPAVEAGECDVPVLRHARPDADDHPEPV
jgi:hypothetical protein